MYERERERERERETENEKEMPILRECVVARDTE